MNQKVDDFINNVAKWQKEFETLRMIILETGLTEDFKWGCPCYTFKNKNVVLIHGFKEYCAVLFFKGALLFDEKKILIQQTENVQAARQIRFKNNQEIVAIETTVTEYIYEAIEVEKAGLQVALKKNTELEFPEEFTQKIKENPAILSSFEALTPGRQRAYIHYFNEAKQSKTRVTRIENYIPKILSGHGLNDCTCGLSKRMPNCDGSHKHIK